MQAWGQVCRTVLLNGQPMALGAGDRLPALAGRPLASEQVVVAPASISFVALTGAASPACSALTRRTGYSASLRCRSSLGVFPNSAPNAVEKCEPDENPHISPTCTIE